MSEATQTQDVPVVVTTRNLTVREVIAKLANMEDMDAEVCFTFHNSDPIPVIDVSDNGEGQIVFSS